MERAIVFLAGEAEYLQIEQKGDGYAIALGDQGLGELPDGVGKDVPDAIVDAILHIRSRARRTQETADKVLEGLRTPGRNR